MSAQRRRAIAIQLTQLERQLRQLAWWSEQPPTPEALSSQAPFCLDTLSFEAWLQWVFIERMEQLLVEGKPLPQRSAMRAMGEQAWEGRASGDLLQVLAALDELLTQAQPPAALDDL